MRTLIGAALIPAFLAAALTADADAPPFILQAGGIDLYADEFRIDGDVVGREVDSLVLEPEEGRITVVRTTRQGLDGERPIAVIQSPSALTISTHTAPTASPTTSFAFPGGTVAEFAALFAEQFGDGDPDGQPIDLLVGEGLGEVTLKPLTIRWRGRRSEAATRVLTTAFGESRGRGMPGVLATDDRPLSWREQQPGIFVLYESVSEFGGGGVVGHFGGSGGGPGGAVPAVVDASDPVTRRMLELAEKKRDIVRAAVEDGTAAGSTLLDAEMEFERMRSRYEARRAEAGRAEANVRAAEASLKEAERQLARVNKLYERNDASREELAGSHYIVEAASAKLRAATRRLASFGDVETAGDRPAPAVPTELAMLPVGPFLAGGGENAADQFRTRLDELLSIVFDEFGDAPAPKVLLHPETKLLLARGTAEQLELLKRLLETWDRAGVGDSSESGPAEDPPSLITRFFGVSRNPLEYRTEMFGQTEITLPESHWKRLRTSMRDRLAAFADGAGVELILGDRGSFNGQGENLSMTQLLGVVGVDPDTLSLKQLSSLPGVMILGTIHGDPRFKGRFYYRFVLTDQP